MKTFLEYWPGFGLGISFGNYKGCTALHIIFLCFRCGITFSSY